jgi:hypothetical protein
MNTQRLSKMLITAILLASAAFSTPLLINYRPGNLSGYFNPELRISQFAFEYSTIASMAAGNFFAPAVRITAPEPATFLLIGFALIGVGLLRRRPA